MREKKRTIKPPFLNIGYFSPCTKVYNFLYRDVTIISFFQKYFYLKSMIKLGKLKDARGTFDSILKWT